MFRIRQKSPGRSLTRKLRRGAILASWGGLSIGLLPRVLPRVGQPGCLRGGLREEPRPALAGRSFSIEPPACRGLRVPMIPSSRLLRRTMPTTEMLSPVPQRPDNRLIVPVGGDGPSRHDGRWMRERDQARTEGKINDLIYDEPGNGGRAGTPQPRIAPAAGYRLAVRPGEVPLHSPAVPWLPAGAHLRHGLGSAPAAAASPAVRLRRPRGAPTGAVRPPKVPSVRLWPPNSRIPGRIPKVRRQYS